MAEARQITAAYLAYNRGIMPQVVSSSAVIAIGMLTLIPIGLVLRELFGRGMASDLLAAELMGAGLLGAIAEMLIGGANVFAAHVQPGALAGQPEFLASFSYARGMVASGAEWVLYAFYVLVGLAAWRAGRVARQLGVLPTEWANLGIVPGVGCWVEAVTRFLSAAMLVPYTFLISQIVLLLIGVVVAPIWLGWLGQELGRKGQVVLSPRPV